MLKFIVTQTRTWLVETEDARTMETDTLEKMCNETIPDKEEIKVEEFKVEELIEPKEA